MNTYRYEIIDVFTDQAYEGNPLAVVYDAEGLDTRQMQRIAAEFNLSETVFFFAPEHVDTLARLRIFMPTHELPFAGHPTVGSAYALFASGRVPAGDTEFVLQENIGPIAIRLEQRNPFRAWFETPPMRVGAALERERVAAALSLDVRELLDIPPEIVGAGNDFVFAGLRSRAAVDRVVVDTARMRTDEMLSAVEGLFVFTPVATGVYARMLAPLAGIAEDPATGSATGPLALYLTRHGLAPLRDEFMFVNEQGVQMGRRSLLHAKLHVEGGKLTGVEIGGSAVPVMSGELRA